MSSGAHGVEQLRPHDLDAGQDLPLVTHETDAQTLHITVETKATSGRPKGENSKKVQSRGSEGCGLGRVPKTREKEI